MFASEYLRAFKEYRMIIYGGLLIGLMALGGQGLRGLAGTLLAAGRHWARLGFRSPAR